MSAPLAVSVPMIEPGAGTAFAGSGTTLIAGRRGYGIEIDCHYTDTVIRRFDEVYGLKAVHAEFKLDFERLTNERFKEKRHGQKATNGGTAQKIGNPPKHPQFGKGTAGNPMGRPRGPKTSALTLSGPLATRSSRRHVGGVERFRSYRRRR